jgi:hypothetical protein
MRISLMVVILLAWTSAARADRGSIPFKLDVKIYEPNQDALIAWNGREQLLLLQTKLRASKPTKILELIPLPSKPTVEKGNTKAFARATALINRRQRRRARSRNGDLGDPFNGHGKRKPAAVVRERKRIGAHDIAVVEVLRKKDFVAWVHTFLAKQGLPASLLPAPLTRITERYLSDGYRWFVFDVVAVGTRNTRIAPIAYRFASTSALLPAAHHAARIRLQPGQAAALYSARRSFCADPRDDPRGRGQATLSLLSTGPALLREPTPATARRQGRGDGDGKRLGSLEPMGLLGLAGRSTIRPARKGAAGESAPQKKARARPPISHQRPLRSIQIKGSQRCHCPAFLCHAVTTWCAYWESCCSLPVFGLAAMMAKRDGPTMPVSICGETDRSAMLSSTPIPAQAAV